jgi:predicted NAD/FAD-binding protein
MKLAVVGAGYAGMAAAVELAAAGHAVDVFEASRVAGGRARATRIGDLTVDNGQHILVGAYSETLRLMRAVGVDPDRVLKRTPLRFEFPGEFLMQAPRLPAPLHTAFALLLAQGLDWREKLAAIRLMRGLQADDYRVAPDRTVSAWLEERKTPSRQRRLLWEPLCIAALNTPADRASAQVLANVLRDSLGGARDASDMLLPQVDLTALFPGPAAELSSSHGGSVQLGAASPACAAKAMPGGSMPTAPTTRWCWPWRPTTSAPAARAGRPGRPFRVGTHRHQLLPLSRQGHAPAATHAGRRRRPRAMAVRPRPALRPARA